MRHVLTMLLIALGLSGATSGVRADYLLLVDPVRLSAAVAVRGPGLDGRIVRPRAVAAACIRDSVLGPGAYSPARDRCRAVPGVAGLTESLGNLPVIGTEPGTTVIDHVSAGGVVAIETRRRLACRPGACTRELFDDAGYPPELASRPVPPPLPQPSIQQFNAEPDAVLAGEAVTLSWATSGVNRCRLATNSNGATLLVDATGTVDVEPGRNTVWTLTCAAPGGRAVAQTTATVTRPALAPDIVIFEPLRDDVPVGAPATLVWQVDQAEQCALDDGETIRSVPPTGRRSVPVFEDTRFVLACAGPSGLADAMVDVGVTPGDAPPEITFFQLARSEIQRGDSVVAAWEAPAASACVLRDDTAGVSWKMQVIDQFRLAPGATGTWTLTCRNAYGQTSLTRPLEVNDMGEPLELLSFTTEEWAAAAPRGGSNVPELSSPGLVRVTWTTQSATTCRLTSDAGQEIGIPLNDSIILPIERTTGLQINCASATAEAQALGQVRVLSELLFADQFEP